MAKPMKDCYWILSVVGPLLFSAGCIDDFNSSPFVPPDGSDVSTEGESQVCPAGEIPCACPVQRGPVRVSRCGGSRDVRRCLREHAYGPEQLWRLRHRVPARAGVRRGGTVRCRVRRGRRLLPGARTLLRGPDERYGELRRLRPCLPGPSPLGSRLRLRRLRPHVRHGLDQPERHPGRRVRMPVRGDRDMRWRGQQLRRTDRRGIRVHGLGRGGLHPGRGELLGRAHLPGGLHLVRMLERGLGVLAARQHARLRKLRHPVLPERLLLEPLRVRGRVRAGSHGHPGLRQLQRSGAHMRQRLHLGRLGRVHGQRRLSARNHGKPGLRQLRLPDENVPERLQLG
jgi:hypothetical protein